MQFLNNVIIIKTKVLLRQADVTLSDVGCPAYARSYGSLLSKLVNYLAFNKTRRVHLIKYRLRFYFFCVSYN